MRRIRAASPLAWLPWILVLSLAFLPACGDDDDGGTGPGNGGGDNGDPTGNLPNDGSDLQAIGEAAVQSLNVGTQLVSQVAAWAGGIGAPRADTEPFWNSQTNSWVWQVEEILSANFPNSESRFWTFSVQYMKDEVPQQSPDGADYARATISMNYSLSRFTSEENNRSMSVSLQCDAFIYGLGTSTLDVEVDGEGEIFADFTIGGEYSYFYNGESVSIHVEFELTEGGCPEGLGNFFVDTTIVDWTYVGGADYSWKVSNNGVLAQGTASLPCGNN